MVQIIPAKADSFVPVIDMAPYFAGTPEGKLRVAAELDRACREVGFYVIVGHGVDPAFDRADRMRIARFFDLPIDEKMKVHIGDVPGGVGYSAVGDTSLANTRGQVAPPDLNESFQIAKVDVTDDPYFQSEAARGMVPSNRWPDRPAALKALYTEYYLTMGGLAADLMRLSALALGLPETYFETRSIATSAASTFAFTQTKNCAVARPAARRCAYRLWHGHDPQARRQSRRPSVRRRQGKLARCSGYCGIVCRQPG